ncbi:unnamed protein product [Gongylonema pulchrum]|uniref:Protein kinase domain-containing protein n=1 Tax=Gongylonema pulchrum TaxID=637853 RepID=A0A183EZG8_9BILA|nr:unnamed protein product [Gongylonema pulchrum]
MQVLYLMTKSSYKPPTLKDRYKWSPFFHDFIKQCLTKNPKKRPTPEKLLSGEAPVLSRIKSRSRADPRAACDAIRVRDEANALMARIWNEPSTSDVGAGNLGWRYHEVSRNFGVNWKECEVVRSAPTNSHWLI